MSRAAAALVGRSDKLPVTVSPFGARSPMPHGSQRQDAKERHGPSVTRTPFRLAEGLMNVPEGIRGVLCALALNRCHRAMARTGSEEEPPLRGSERPAARSPGLSAPRYAQRRPPGANQRAAGCAG